MIEDGINSLKTFHGEGVAEHSNLSIIALFYHHVLRVFRLHASSLLSIPFR